MRMKLWVLIPGRPVLEGGDGEADLLAFAPELSSPGEAGDVFEVVEPSLDARAVALLDHPPHVLRGDRPEGGDGLVGAERAVEPGPVVGPARVLSQGVVPVRREALEEVREIFPLDRAG